MDAASAGVSAKLEAVSGSGEMRRADLRCPGGDGDGNMEAAMKRLVIFFDGTWSLPVIETNVHRLYEITAPADAAHVVQLKKYWNGVGTRWMEVLRGGILGFGTGRNICEAYEWLQANYEDGDHVFILGFSRGAYSARSLAGMISRCGLLQSNATTTVAQIYQRYAVKNEELVADSRRIPIHFLGVWDTVGELGVPWGNFPGVSRSTILFHNTSPSPRYRNMFHALAIDENRSEFEPTLWTAGEEDGFTLQPDQRLEQCWFAGSHSDVGGGGLDSGLARITLAWMRDRATECGLAFTRKIEVQADDHSSLIRDSFATFMLGAYRLVRFNRRYFRPIGQATVQTPKGQVHPLNETIDASVFRRWRDDPTYRTSKNLVDWAQQRGLDPADIHETIPARATTP
ncbi:MAG TPA: DUF2235 domain-containing protein [Kineosporiaceae bacterium]|nr:DUF2235 domain-containing protein [Kineosporiaceae bacterium]